MDSEMDLREGVSPCFEAVGPKIKDKTAMTRRFAAHMSFRRTTSTHCRGESCSVSRRRSGRSGLS